MDKMDFKPEEIWQRLPIILENLQHATPHNLENLSLNEVQRVLGIEGKIGGVYLFSLKEGNKPLYIGRTANLPQRISNNHRSTEENMATVTAAIMHSQEPEFEDITTMDEARVFLYKKCSVRMLIEKDICTRAIFEIYASMHLNTPFNTFKEH